MPLYYNAREIILSNLTQISLGQRPAIIGIGTFTFRQMDQINTARKQHALHDLENEEILYIGSHHYNSRNKDGYSCLDMFLQIEACLCDLSVVVSTSRMTALDSHELRHDGYGNKVRDRAIFELTQRKPRAELFSAIPKGDHIKPNGKGPPMR